MNAAPRHLTRAQLREIERELRRERARLELSLTTRTETGGGRPPPESALQARPDAGGGLAVALETRTLSQHQALVAALRRLETGTFGLCASCHAPIPYGRLLVMPEVTHCITCGARA